jgi:hypothetical protein
MVGVQTSRKGSRLLNTAEDNRCSAVYLELAERVGFSKALYCRLFVFNEMPKTAVLTGTYVLPHLEHESHKKR